MAQVDSLRAENKFKKTETGNIPVDWNIVKIKDIISLDYGKGLPENKREGDRYPVYGSNGIVGYHKGYLVEGPGIIIGRKGTVGCVTWSNIDFWPIDTTYYVATNTTKINLRWLYYLLINLKLNRLNAATGIPGLNRNVVSNLAIALPPFSEQKKISEVLSTVDEAIEKSKEIIEKTKELKKGLMQKLLTRGIEHKKFKKTKIAEIPVEWKVVKLKELYKSPIRDFGSFSTTKLVKYISEGIPFLRSENFKEGRLVHENIMYISEEVHRKLGKSFIKKGVLMFTKIGNIGHSDIYDGQYGECNSNATIAKIDIDEKKAFVPYIRWILNSKIAMKQFQGRIISTPPRINLGEISKLSIPLPIYSEQEKIAEMLNKLESIIDNEEKRKNVIETLKNGLMQSLLTGKTRVKT